MLLILRYLKTRHILLLFFVWAAGCGDAQAQPNGAWVMGTELGLDFSSGFPVAFKSENRNRTFGSTYLDSSGKMLIAFDGRWVYDYANQRKLSEPDSFLSFLHRTTELNAIGTLIQSVLIRSKKNPNTFFLFYTVMFKESNIWLSFRYAVLQYNQDYSNLTIEKKNLTLFEPPFESLTPTLNAQLVGDTILVTFRNNNNIKTGYYPPSSSHFVLHLMENDNAEMEIVLVDTLHYFSPDVNHAVNTYGSANAMLGLSDTFAEITLDMRRDTFLVHLRSNKPFSKVNSLNRVLDTFPYTLNSGHTPTSLCFSPNGRFLYVLLRKREMSTTYQRLQIRQYDLWENNWELVWDCGREDDYLCREVQILRDMRISPDGRILFCRGMGTPPYSGEEFAIGAIHYPNKKGKACGVAYPYMLVAKTLNINKPPDYNPLFSFPKYLGNYQFPAFSLAQNCIDTAILLNESGNGFTSFRWVVNDKDTFYRDNYEPLHYKFAKNGKYVVRLTARDAEGYKHTFADSITVWHKPTASFSTASEKGCQWVAFNFNNQSQWDTVRQQMRWQWQSGDGFDTTMLGGQGNFSHIYRKDGLYTSRLIIDDGFCTDTFEQASLIEILPAPQPGFSFTPQTGCQPLTAYFSDSHPNDPIDSVRYSFGIYSKTLTRHFDSEPLIFATAGKYAVTQTLYGITGCLTQSTQNIEILKGFDSAVSMHLHYVSLGQNEQTHQLAWQKLIDAKIYEVNQYQNKQWQSIYQGRDTLYEHFIADKNNFPVKYFITGYDTCGKALNSNTGNTLLLEGESKENEYTLLNWTPYDFWPDGIEEYLLEKQNPNTGFWHKLLSTADTQTQDIDFFDASADEACYRVKAISVLNASYQSLSNTLCLPYSPLFWLPNAFTPNADGRNDVFMPMSSGIIDEGYQLSIYNRWGALVFESNDRKTGWDGTVSGKIASEGVYTYMIKFAYIDGKGIKRRKNHSGNITLIR